MKHDICSGVLPRLAWFGRRRRFRPISLLHHNSPNATTTMLQAEFRRNSKPGFWPLPAYLFIWKCHCNSYTSRAGGDAELQNSWWFPSHRCHLCSYFQHSPGPGTVAAACWGHFAGAGCPTPALATAPLLPRLSPPCGRYFCNRAVSDMDVQLHPHL